MPDIQAVEQDGEELFRHFILEEVERAGINQLDEALGIPEGYGNSAWAALGGSLKEVADEFSRDKKAGRIREQAGKANLENIDQERFIEILTELFTDGFSKERVIALFLFCSYALIRAFYENRVELCKNMFLWALEFVKSEVCRWVYDHGGWGKVLGKVYDVVFRILALSAFAVVIIAGVVYISVNNQ